MELFYAFIGADKDIIRAIFQVKDDYFQVDVVFTITSQVKLVYIQLIKKMEEECTSRYYIEVVPNSNSHSSATFHSLQEGSYNASLFPLSENELINHAVKSDAIYQHPQPILRLREQSQGDSKCNQLIINSR